MAWTSLDAELVPDAALTAAFSGCLPGEPLAGPLLAFETVDSTQRVARRLAADGAPEGTVVVANHQTAGRGQGTRRWFAARGTGLLLSCLLRPPLPAARWPALTGVAAAAVVEAVTALTSLRPVVKWPNDVLAGTRKLAGVLADGIVGAEPLVVVGIGVNVLVPAWPAELREHAVSLAELGHPVSRALLLRAVLSRLAAGYARFLSGEAEPA